MDWACLSVQEINLWDIDVTRTESLLVSVCVCECVCVWVCVCVWCVCLYTLYVSETRKHSGIPGPLEGSSLTR